MRRINFVADLVGDTSLPGVQSIVGRLQASGDISTGEFVDTCLDLMGPLDLASATRQELIDHADIDGDLKWNSDEDAEFSTMRVSEMLQLIVSLRDYQYA